MLLSPTRLSIVRWRQDTYSVCSLSASTGGGVLNVLDGIEPVHGASGKRMRVCRSAILNYVRLSGLRVLSSPVESS